MVWLHEGSRIVGFGRFQEYTYRKVRNWICEVAVNANGVLQGSSLVSKEVANFSRWMQKLQHAMEDAKMEAVWCVIHLYGLKTNHQQREF